MRRAVARGLLLLAVVALAGGVLYLSTNSDAAAWFKDRVDRAGQSLGLMPQDVPAGLVASGFVEAEEVSVSGEVGGRIVALNAGEADEVTAGQPLVLLDDSLLRTQIASAEADLLVAQATLAQVKADARQATLAYAQAVVDQAKAAQAAALVGLRDAEEMVKNPQDLELAIAAARSQLGVLDFQEQQAQALANAAQAARDLSEDIVVYMEEFEPYEEWFLVGEFDLNTLPDEFPLPDQISDGEYIMGSYKLVISGGVISVYVLKRIAVGDAMLDEARREQALATYDSWQAWTGLAQAQAVRSGLESQLEQLAEQKADPVTLQTRANSARSQYSIATAAVDVAQAQLDGMKIGATPAQIAAAEAQVEVARAALEALQVQAQKLTLVAPITGLVLECPVHVGEIATPGVPLLTVARLDKLMLTIYVPEDQLGAVSIGQPVAVTVDAYPGRTFTGAVRSIGTEAQFTPKNVQTREERVNMVFAVEVELPNPDHALKPGMPADAVVGEQGKP